MLHNFDVLYIYRVNKLKEMAAKLKELHTLIDQQV